MLGRHGKGRRVRRPSEVVRRWCPTACSLGIVLRLSVLLLLVHCTLVLAWLTLESRSIRLSLFPRGVVQTYRCRYRACIIHICGTSTA